MKEAIGFVSQCGIESAKSLMRMGSGVCRLNGGEFHTDQLKEIVDALELIQNLGGIQAAKDAAYQNTMNVDGFDPSKIETAIALVEEVEKFKGVP